jgi:hypothetical protein
MNNKQQVIGALKVLKDSYGVAASAKQNIAVGRAIALVDVVMNDTPTKDVIGIDWKPLDITQMIIKKPYLLAGLGWTAPDVGVLLDTGFIESWNLNGDAEYILYDRDKISHYAEFNMPEGGE